MLLWTLIWREFKTPKLIQQTSIPGSKVRQVVAIVASPPPIFWSILAIPVYAPPKVEVRWLDFFGAMVLGHKSNKRSPCLLHSRMTTWWGIRFSLQLRVAHCCRCISNPTAGGHCAGPSIHLKFADRFYLRVDRQ
jgi:hypothetical protein